MFHQHTQKDNVFHKYFHTNLVSRNIVPWYEGIKLFHYLNIDTDFRTVRQKFQERRVDILQKHGDIFDRLNIGKFGRNPLHMLLDRICFGNEVLSIQEHKDICRCEARSDLHFHKDRVSNIPDPNFHLKKMS